MVNDEQFTNTFIDNKYNLYDLHCKQNLICTCTLDDKSVFQLFKSKHVFFI